MCESKDLIVGYVYDELSSEERSRFQAHLAVCADCTVEIDGLLSTRMHLARWAPPEPDLGFRVIRGGAAPADALPRRSRFVPAFSFAAAAVIVLAAAAALANIEVRYGADGMVVRTGWARGADLPQTSGDARPAMTAAASEEFAALESRLRQIESSLGERSITSDVQSASPASTSPTSRMSDAEILRRVRQMVGEAEARQETAVARRLLDVVKDFDHQRRTDIALIQQGLGQYQGLANAEIAQNRDMLNQLVRAATTRQER